MRCASDTRSKALKSNLSGYCSNLPIRRCMDGRVSRRTRRILDVVKCHLLSVRAKEGKQSAWLRINVVDVIRLQELSHRVEVQYSDSLLPYPTQRAVRADWGDLTYFDGNNEHGTLILFTQEIVT